MFVSEHGEYPRQPFPFPLEAGLTGPHRRIKVEPVPERAPAPPERAPARPAKPAPARRREKEKVPA